MLRPQSVNGTNVLPGRYGAGGVNVLVVWAHPRPESFSRAVLDRVVAARSRAGHRVDVLDLYGDGFDPVMTAGEWRAYQALAPQLDATGTRHVELVRRADELVFVYPTWWFGLPAILKGWLERTLVPGVAFDLDDRGRVVGGLGRLRRVVGVATYGSAPWYCRIIGDAGRRTLTRAVRLSGPRPWRIRTTWLACYRMDTLDDTDRNAFLDRIDRVLGPGAGRTGRALPQLRRRRR